MNTETKVQTSAPTTAPKASKKGVNLYKRDGAGRPIGPEDPTYAERPFYFRFQFRGERLIRCTDTNVESKAQAIAKVKIAEIREAAIRGEVDRIKATRRNLPKPEGSTKTVAELCKAYSTSPGKASESTRTQNVNALKQFLRTLHGEDTDVEALNVGEINGKLASHWFTQATQKANAAADQVTQNSIRKSANSRMVQASSLFSDLARYHYAQQELDHPSFSDFLKVGAMHKFGHLPKAQFNPPSEAIIARTLEAWLKIEDRNLFLAIGHELAFGLRAGDMGQAKWSWWGMREGYPVLDSSLEGSAWTKNGSGLIQVRALDPWFNQMRAKMAAKGWRGADDDYILTGSTTVRTDTTFRAVSQFMRDMKWATMKTNHALRAYAGSQIAMRYGIYEASVWLRHSSVNVTEQHYSYFVKRFKPADVTTIPARWATPDQTPVLSIVNA